FFQAEDGIRDFHVTGVQTCALPIYDSTLFEVDIHTGRAEQIRIHLAAIGHPLVGDPLYAPGGLPRAVDPGLPGDGGYLLHAMELRLIHPVSGLPLHLVAPPPPILRKRDEGG